MLKAFPWSAAQLLALLCGVVALAAQAPATNTKTSYVSFGNRGNALLLEPATVGPRARIALIYTHPALDNFGHASGPELAGRGYRVLLLNHYLTQGGEEGIAPSIAAAVKYLRGLSGVEKVLFVTHSGGGPIMTFYQNVAENGPKACQGPEKIAPCHADLTALPRADGLILLDSVAGSAFHEMTAVDPAVENPDHPQSRTPALDMFDARNGYDPATKTASYSPAFTKSFFTAQAARNARLIDLALARLAAVEHGRGAYKDDEPLVVPGTGVNAAGARPYQTDVRLVSRTRAPHPVLKADGTAPTQIAVSVRPPLGMNPAALGTLEGASQTTTVRRFLTGYAIRTTRDYGWTENDITGVDWDSSITSVPSNIKGVTVPTLIMTMGCHYFLVPDEIAFNNSPAKDKQYVVVDGATHVFRPCKPEYGDTQKRLFDYIDQWIGQPGRF